MAAMAGAADVVLSDLFQIEIQSATHEVAFHLILCVVNFRLRHEEVEPVTDGLELPLFLRITMSLASNAKTKPRGID